MWLAPFPHSLTVSANLLVLFTAFGLGIMPQLQLTVNKIGGIMTLVTISPLKLDSLPQAGSSLVINASSLMVDLPHAPRLFYRHGWQSWSNTTWLDPSSPPKNLHQPIKRLIDEDAVYAQHPRHISSGVGAVELENGQVVLLGGLDLEARVEIDGQTLRGFFEQGVGDWLLTTGDSIQTFKIYADSLSQRVGHSKTDRAPRVWCSWYSLYPLISERRLLRVVNDLGDLPFDVIQIDDGWQANISDWEANKKFPSGMAAMAESIRKSGRRAGLWLAPFVARDNSPLYRNHPDWFLSDDKGNPVLAHNNWGGPVYALDTTHPSALEWIATLIKKVRGWGYDYLKLDFMSAGALPGKRFEDAPRETAYRRGLQTIREAAGDVYVLACGAPILPSIGLCDGLRVGPDTAPYWKNKIIEVFPTNHTAPEAFNALRISLERYWLNRLVHIDPDVVYFRSKYCSLTNEQKKMTRDLGAITGFKAISDLPDWLIPSDKAAIRAYLELNSTVEQVDWYRFKIDGREVDFHETVKVTKQLSTKYDPVRVEKLLHLFEILKVGLPALLESRKK